MTQWFSKDLFLRPSPKILSFSALIQEAFGAQSMQVATQAYMKEVAI